MRSNTKPQWKRTQIEAALWRYVVTARNWGADFDGLTANIPTVFRSRIKKLLNMDRIPALTPWGQPKDDKWAFYDSPGEGLGSEDRFSTEHAFLIGIALDLVNEGSLFLGNLQGVRRESGTRSPGTQHNSGVTGQLA